MFEPESILQPPAAAEEAWLRLSAPGVPTFSGREDFATWRLQVVGLLASTRASPLQQRTVVMTQLRDKAATYAAAVLTPDDGPMELLEHLAAVFGPTPPSTALVQLHDARQLPGESAAVFFTRIALLAAAAGVADIRTHFMTDSCRPLALTYSCELPRSAVRFLTQPS